MRLEIMMTDDFCGGDLRVPWKDPDIPGAYQECKIHTNRQKGKAVKEPSYIATNYVTGRKEVIYTNTTIEPAGWRDVGSGHRIEDGMYVREVTTIQWFVEIPDIETLADLIKWGSAMRVENYGSDLCLVVYGG